MGDYIPIGNNIKYHKDTYSKRKNKNGYIVILISYILWIIFYKASLIGGSLEWIKDHLFLIGILLTTAFLSYSIMLWRIAFMKISKKRKIILYLIAVLSELGYLLYDHGELFDYHGMYNFLLFCLFIFFVEGFALGLSFCYFFLGGKRFLFSLFLTKDLLFFC